MGGGSILIALYQYHAAPRMVLMTSSSLPTMHDRATRPQCSECEFMHSHQDFLHYHNGTLPKIVRMDGQTFGRTGNVVVSIFKAMQLAYMCKSAMELPVPPCDKKCQRHSTNVFQYQLGWLDFTQRPGEASTDLLCDIDVVGSYKEYFEMSRFSVTDVWALSMLWDCMRQYLGICVQGFCEGHRSAQDGVLVAHLRQGDIYLPNYSSNVVDGYHQPSLAYYYSVINFTKPEKVIFVGENSHHGPVWEAFGKLQSFGMIKFDIEFQTSTFGDDMMTMLCARKIVESISSLMIVTRLGFASQLFTSSCQMNGWGVQSLPNAQEIYSVDPGPFADGHSNSAEAWVASLLHGTASFPVRCDVLPVPFDSEQVVGSDQH
jgi:hypothetical protein